MKLYEGVSEVIVKVLAMVYIRGLRWYSKGVSDGIVKGIVMV